MSDFKLWSSEEIDKPSHHKFERKQNKTKNKLVHGLETNQINAIIGEGFLLQKLLNFT